MKVMVVGNGAREHAICARLANSRNVEKLFCVPGNGGIRRPSWLLGDYSNVAMNDVDALLGIALNECVDLAVIGPEAPLVNGIADRFRANGILICGPSQEAAIVTEGSKAQFKRFLARHGIPTPEFKVFGYKHKREAINYIRKVGVVNIVIKADGLMGGKGVVLPATLQEAKDALDQLMKKGTAGENVLIEERMTGIERSVMAITDGQEVRMFPLTQDYKRLLDGDEGLNTGGMGAHTIDVPAEEARALSELLSDVVRALFQEGITYSGFGYLGAMMTSSGPQVLEWNCRLGDPETQVLLECSDGDFLSVCLASARGDISALPEIQRVHHSVCVVMASREYPASSERDDVILNTAWAAKSGVSVYHGGTAYHTEGEHEGRFTTNKSGRVLSVVGSAHSLADAKKCAYEAVNLVQFPGAHYRSDIGA